MERFAVQEDPMINGSIVLMVVIEGKMSQARHLCEAGPGLPTMTAPNMRVKAEIDVRDARPKRVGEIRTCGSRKQSC